MFKLRLIALTLLIYGFMFGIAYLIAGTWTLPFFWAVFSIQIMAGLVAIVVLDDDLLSERVRSKGKDLNPSGPLLLSVLFFALIAVAALDVGRLHYSDHVGVQLQILALVLHALTQVAFLWAMRVNNFFSAAIRLQPDRDQRVITTGPYAWIRHPGYACAVPMFLSEAIALGSWLAVIPALLIIASLAYRTVMEEKLLADGLPGYPEYAQRVRYRWIPGIW